MELLRVEDDAILAAMGNILNLVSKCSFCWVILEYTVIYTAGFSDHINSDSILDSWRVETPSDTEVSIFASLGKERCRILAHLEYDIYYTRLARLLSFVLESLKLH